MHSKFKKFGLLFATVFVCGCSTTEVVEPTTPLVQDEFIFELGELPAQTLELGDCGLFLFAAQPKPRFVFFGEATKGIGKIVLNGKETTLVRSETDGDVIDLHYTEQTFTSPVEDIELKVTINEADFTEGGAQISKASIRMRSSEGWRMVIPVGGATSCRSN